MKKDDKKQNQLFSIGEMARLFHLKVGTLRYYEAEGLLAPEYVDEASGYRYYSVRQFEPLNTIRYLRALDMPLEEIADFLRSRDLDKIEEKLRQQKAEVARRQQALAVIERKIDRRLWQLRDARETPLGVISLRTMPGCRLIRLENALKIGSFLDMELPIRALEKDGGEAAVFLGKVGIGISASELLAGNYTRYGCIFLVLEEDENDDSAEVLPPMECVSVRFCGGHTEAPEHYDALMAYVRERNLIPVGFSREITLIDYGVTSDRSQFVTEISIPVSSGGMQ